VHTSSYTFAFLVYHLARSPSEQDLLREEAISLWEESGGVISRDMLARAHYARACLRHGTRIHFTIQKIQIQKSNIKRKK
jgi:cytochrome P450